MIDILRRHAGEFVRGKSLPSGQRSQPCPQVQSTLAKISVCRTEALGPKLYACDDCGAVKRVHHSCGDRHCPQCRGASRADWVTAAEEWILPGVDYYQVVFTIPDCLSSLALGNRRELFNLLFRSAWKSLKETLESEQRFEAAAAMVLHTWTQKLDAHVHIHAVVPGGGPSLDKPDTWKMPQPPPGRKHHDYWLVDADNLRAAFRERFLAGLKRLHASGRLELNNEWAGLRDATAFADWLSPLETVDWVTYIQPPPTQSSQPTDIVKYLARYLTGGPISDFRITGHDDDRVTFTTRSGTTHGGSDETEDITLTGVEFVRRWSLHILPRGYTKSRRFGGLSNHHAARYLDDCRRLLDRFPDSPAKSSPPLEPPPFDDRVPEPSREEHCCPDCGGRLTLVDRSGRTRWSDLFRNEKHSPRWYRPPIRAA